jgi:hypothetical protein
MKPFKNHTIIVLSACIGSVIVEERYRSLILDSGRTVSVSDLG